jgi:hypothetical protein
MQIYVNKDTQGQVDWILNKEKEFNFSQLFAKSVAEVYESYNTSQDVRLALEVQAAERLFKDAQEELEKKKNLLI